jgi:hypothetical protein
VAAACFLTRISGWYSMKVAIINQHAGLHVRPD